MERINEVKTPQLLISSDHINALIDIIHARTNRQDLSIANTAFFREMVQAKNNDYSQATRYLQPDNAIQQPNETQWKKSAPRIKATASSTILLIPCHLARANHWLLAVRIKITGGRQKFFILDSQGVKAAGKRKRMINDLLKAVGLYGANDTCSIMKTKTQTEWECGARVAQYMINFTEWIGQNNDGETIIRRMTRGITDEKNKQCDLAVESRKVLRDTLKHEKMILGG